MSTGLCSTHVRCPAERVGDVVMQGHETGRAVDQMTSLFSMANLCLAQAQAALLRSGTLPLLVGGALRVCRWREADPLRAALTFLSVFLGEVDPQKLQRPELVQVRAAIPAWRTLWC